MYTYYLLLSNLVHLLEQLRRRERPAQLLLEPEAGGLVPSVGLVRVRVGVRVGVRVSA